MRELVPRTNPLFADHLDNPVTEMRKEVARRSFASPKARRRFCARFLGTLSADEALAAWPDADVFGFTAGQYSMLDIIVAAVRRTGPLVWLWHRGRSTRTT